MQVGGQGVIKVDTQVSSLGNCQMMVSSAAHCFIKGRRKGCVGSVGHPSEIV